jgi:glycosyltransferase involved in cell wall biosynthesis
VTPRLSVVIPAYNEAGYLAETLRSLQDQDFAEPYEVIVVNNGSTDDTAALAQGFGVRVLHEPQPGVCAARQRGTAEARGDIVVSTDADTVHPRDWLTRLDAAFRAHPEAVAVAGPCRYADPPWWAAVFPPLWFAAVAGVHRRFGRVFYLTATNVAFRRDEFPGYDTTLTQGGDEVDLLRRLQRWGPVVWDGGNPVHTSSRRMDQGLPYTLLVSFGYHYATAYLLNRVSRRADVRVAPAIRRHDEHLVRGRRRRWRAGSAVVALSVAALAYSRSRTALRFRH